MRGNGGIFRRTNDGNGRLSRLLTTLLLYRSGFYVGKYISLEALIAKDKSAYYEALQPILRTGVESYFRGWYEKENDVESRVKEDMDGLSLAKV